ncbi:MAG: homocysteine S-methyltransferase family protein [Gammaproteobacteria bacterium]|jgi:homocysteine S-methyltransferase
MNRYNRLMTRINEGECILIDGATGTEVERRGVPQLKNAWNGGGALSHPDIVRKIHQDYINRGAEVIISNTFATTKHALADAGQDANFEALNERGVKLAIEARENLHQDDVLVAGGVSYWTWTEQKPTLNELNASISQQVAIMAAVGADLLMLEMMIDIEQMMTTLKASQSVGLPIWVGLTCEPNATGAMCLRTGDSLEEAIRALKPNKPDVINIMHTEVEYIEQCLDILQSEWSGPVGVYAHSGAVVGTEWTFNDVISPEKYCDYASEWQKRGVSIIGGCCGVHTDHVQMLNNQLFPYSK